MHAPVCLTHFASASNYTLSLSPPLIHLKFPNLRSLRAPRERTHNSRTHTFTAQILHTYLTQAHKKLTQNKQDRSIPFATTLEAVDKLHKAGKFKRLGLSNYTAFEVAEIATTCALRGLVRPTIYQALYNCLFRNIEEELIPACRRYGIAIDAYSPTGGGFLAGTITSVDADPGQGRYAKGRPMEHLTRGRYLRPGIIEGARIIREASERAGIPPLEVAMRWIAHHSALRGRNRGGSDGVVIGFSSLEQLRQNLDALEKGGPLGEEVLKALENAWRAAKPDADVYWQLPLVYGYDTVEMLFGKTESA